MANVAAKRKQEAPVSAVVKRQKGNTLTVARPQTEYHDELYATRMTRQEQLLFDFQRSAEEAQRNSDYLISKLSFEVESLKKETKDSNAAKSDLTALHELLKQRDAEIQQLKKEIKKHKSSAKTLEADSKSAFKIFNVVRHLTGADVEIKSQTEAGQILFVCNQTGRNGNFKYHLGLESEDANEITYEPIVETKEDKAILKSLPGYMSSSISFSRKEAISLFNKISHVLNQKKPPK